MVIQGCQKNIADHLPDDTINTHKLIDAQAVSGSLAQGRWRYFTFAGHVGDRLTVRLDKHRGNGVLFVREEGEATPQAFTCRCDHPDATTEMCSITLESNGNVSIAIRANETMDYTLQARATHTTKHFELTAYNPPSKAHYDDVDAVWQYYKGAHLKSVSRIDPNNAELFDAAKRAGLGYYLDLRHTVFNINGDEATGLDGNGTDYLRGERYCEGEDSTYNDADDTCTLADGTVYKVHDVLVDTIPSSMLDQVRELARRYKNDRQFQGYWLCDEPFPSAYANLVSVIDAIKEVDPDHPVWINLGRNESTTGIGAEDRIADFVQTTGVSMFSYNFNVLWTQEGYDHWETSETEQVRAYYDQIAMMRSIARAHGIDFMQTIQLVGTENHDPEGIRWREPSAAEHRWYVYSSLAYGVHGLMWFYWEYDGSPDEGWGLTDKPDALKERLYDSLRSIDAQIGTLKEIMATLVSTNVYHTDDSSDAHRPIQAADTNVSAIVGLFEIADAAPDDRDHYAMIVNKDFRHALRASFVLDALRSDYSDIPYDHAPVRLEIFDTHTQRWRTLDASDGHRFGLSLRAGEGVLLRFRFEGQRST